MSTKFILSPEFIAGLFAAEGNFTITSTGRWYRPYTTIALNLIDGELVEMIYAYFKGVGNIRDRPRKLNKKGEVEAGPAVEWETNSIHVGMTVIIPFFTSYPLFSNKSLSFNIWSECVGLLNGLIGKPGVDLRQQIGLDIAYYREELNPTGGELKYDINHARSVFTKAAVDTPPSKLAKLKADNETFAKNDLPLIRLPDNFVSGYITGDGGFIFGFRNKAPKGKKNLPFFWNFNVTSADKNILLAIKNFFGVGHVSPFEQASKKGVKRTYYRYMVTKQEDFIRIYEQHFSQFPLYGKKARDAELLYLCLSTLAEREHSYQPWTKEMRDKINTYIAEKALNSYIQ